MEIYGDDYDIPDDVKNAAHSEAFSEFMNHWFVSSMGLTRGEVELDFLERLTVEERELAKGLLRGNLSLNYTHIVEGLALLGDVSAVPELRRMVAAEKDSSRRLTLAGSLWKLVKDDVFVECLREMVTGDDATLKQAHINQILWLEDERSIDLVIDLLDDDDSFVRFLALSCLNDIEFGKHHLLPLNALPCQAPGYKNRRTEESFRKMMVERLLEYRKLFTNGK